MTSSHPIEIGSIPKCPRCGSMDLIEGNISYDGCITDYDRYGESQAWRHDSYQCKVCKTKFTIWDEEDDFTPIPPNVKTLGILGGIL